MKDIPQEFRMALNERFMSAPWVWLLEVEVPTDPVQVVRICNGSKGVKFDSDNTGSARQFYPAGFSFNSIRFDTAGSLPNLPLSISNVTREAGAILIENDFLVEQAVRLTLVNTGTLDNPEAKISFLLEIRSSAVNVSAVTFNLSTYALHSVTAPQRRLGRSICDHRYGGLLCGFDIDFLDPGLALLGLCPKTEDACTLRGLREAAMSVPVQHPQRIGIFKGLPLAGQ